MLPYEHLNESVPSEPLPYEHLNESLPNEHHTESPPVTPTQSEPPAPLFCTITNPEKVGEGPKAYVIYTFNTKSENNATVSVQRRYNEFYSLYQNLKIEFPHLILPPFPEKSLNPLVNTEFLEHRRKGFEKFMRKVIHHPELALSPSLQSFMTSPVLDKDFVLKTGSVTGFISSSITSAVTGGPTSYKEIDPQYDEYKAYYTNLERSSQSLVTAVSGLSTKLSTSMKNYTDVADAASAYATAENGMDPLTAKSYLKYCQVLSQLSLVQEEFAQTEAIFSDTFKELVAEAESAKEILSNRHKQLWTVQSLEYEEKSKEKNNKTKPADLQQVRAKLQKEQENFDKLNEKISNELEGYSKKKRQQVKALMKEYIHTQIALANKSIVLWKEQLEDIQDSEMKNTRRILKME